MTHKSVLLAALSAAAFACGTAKSPDAPIVVRDLTPAEDSVVAASNSFGYKLFSEVVSRSDGGNIFISPLSVSMALGMTYNGARGSTAAGMATALEFGDLTLDEVNQSYRGLIDLLLGLDPKVTMEIANSIWLRTGFEVLQDFAELNQTFFDAVVSTLDFSSPDAAPTINGWVSDKTHGKITKIVDDVISGDTVMFLIDAIYFKGTWTYQFDPNVTADRSFSVSDSEQKTVKMMSMEANLPYLETEEFQAVDLPYGDGLFSMTVLLPKIGVAVDALAADLVQGGLDSWMPQFAVQHGALGLPRFELDYETGLKDVLGALGMGEAFSDAADFSGINGAGGLVITNVKHKTYLRVDEEGTEAAAVTSVEVGVTSAVSGFAMQVDRPFLVVIHDAHSGATLFIGKIVNPPST